MTRVLFALSLETLDDVERREYCRPPDQGLLALARDPSVTELSVADPWRSLPVAVAKRQPVRRRMRTTVRGRQVLRLRPRRLVRNDPIEVEALKRSYARYARQVGSLAELGRGGEVALVTYNPFVAAFCEAPWIGRRVFVCRDDFSSAPRKRPWWPAYREAYARIADRCDGIFAVSDELSQRVAPGRAVTIPNGIDASLWTPEPPVPTATTPYAVYAGTVEGRIDVDLFREVLKVVPRIVVAGYCRDPETGARLRSIPGVELVGSLPQAELVQVVSAASLGIIPHHDTPMTRAMSPLKLYEYLAAGLPVVATDLPPMAEGGARVWTCTQQSEWAPAALRAVAAGVLSPQDRGEDLARISWRKRLEPFVASVHGGRRDAVTQR